MTDSSRDSYIGVQILRGVAAVMVVIFHAGTLVRDRFPAIGDHLLLRAGAGGVDIFFPISGFVIMVSGAGLAGRPGGWRSFLWRRLVRIVPLYWAVTTLKLAAVTAVPGMALHTRLGLWHVLASYLFIFARAPGGAVLPVVPVGWTLNFEMFFYLVFAAALFRGRPVLPVLVAAILGVAALGLAFPHRSAPLTVFDPVVLEFAAGALIAGFAGTGRRLGPRTAATALVLGFLVLIGSDALPMPMAGVWRLLFWGLPGIAIVLAAVSLEPVLRRWRFGLPRLVGDASYSIYLSHGFVLPVIGVLAVKAGLAGLPGAAPVFALTILASIAFGVVVHLGFERPLTRWLRQTLRRRALEVPAAV